MLPPPPRPGAGDILPTSGASVFSSACQGLGFSPHRAGPGSKAFGVPRFWSPEARHRGVRLAPRVLRPASSSAPSTDCLHPPTAREVGPRVVPILQTGKSTPGAVQAPAQGPTPGRWLSLVRTQATRLSPGLAARRTRLTPGSRPSPAARALGGPGPAVVTATEGQWGADRREEAPPSPRPRRGALGYKGGRPGQTSRVRRAPGAPSSEVSPRAEPRAARAHAAAAMCGE